jgi:hypothetical protein
MAGLLKLRRWARSSMLVIGGGMAVMGFLCALMMFVMAAVPFMAPAHADAAQAQSFATMMRVTFGVMGGICLLHSALGIFWLVYFTRKRVAEVFAGGAGGAVESRRPFLISVISVLSVVLVVFCLLAIFLPGPTILFGWVLRGWAKTALCLAFGAAWGAAGVGLWKLKEWGRRLALFSTGIGTAHSAYLLVFPSTFAKYQQEMQQTILPMQPGPMGPMQGTMMQIAFGFSVVWCLAIFWVLIHYRKAFQATVETPAAGVQTQA